MPTTDQNSSSTYQEDFPDEVARKNESAFKYTTIFHSSLCEKLFKELSALALGEFDLAGGQISPFMWTKLHDIYSEVETQTRKLPAGAEYSISSQKYANEAVQIASVLSIYTALAHEYDETQDVSLLSKLVVEDIEFRRVFALLQWSEKAISEQQYEDGLSEKVRRLETLKSVREPSLSLLKRPTFAGNANSLKEASLDPDAPGTKDDKLAEKAALVTLFTLVRCGETLKAANLAVDLGMAAIGAQLQLHAMLRNPLDMPLQTDKRNFSEQKRIRRAKYFQETQTIIDNLGPDELNPYKLLISGLRGNIAPCLAGSTNIIEKIWSYANTAFLARILAAECVMTEEQIATLFNVPMTCKSILDELQTDNHETLILLRVVDDMLNDDIEDLYRFAKETVDGYVPNDINCEVNMLALDIFFHLVAVAYASGFEPNDDGNAVIMLGFDDMRARTGTVSHKRMAGFYSRFLPAEMKIPQIVETMKLVDSSRERLIMADALIEANIDYGLCACTLIQQIRREDESGVIDVNAQIENWNWLIIGGEETSLAAVEECNRLIRKVVLSSFDEPTIRKIIRVALQFDLPRMLSSAVLNGNKILSLIQDGPLFEQDLSDPLTIEKIEHAALEFCGLCSLIDVHNFTITIALKLGLMFKFTPITEAEMATISGVKRKDPSDPGADWEASLRVRARAEQSLQEEMVRRKTVDHNAKVGMVQQHLDTVLPMLRGLINNIGLRAEYFLAPRSSGDPMKHHRQQIQGIRNLMLPNFFLLLSQAAAKLEDVTNFNDFFTGFDDVELGITEKSLQSVRTFLAELNLKHD